MNPYSLPQELKKSERKAAKPMLWISLAGMAMLFAGLTSAYIGSVHRGDWIQFSLPDAFTYSTILLVISSITLYGAKKSIQKNNKPIATAFLVVTFLLGIAFVAGQVMGFQQLIDWNLFFTGEKSVVSSSFLYVIAGLHIVHIFAGLIVLTVLLVQHLKGAYTPDNLLGFSLGSTFWHFLDILWVYLFLFMTYFS